VYKTAETTVLLLDNSVGGSAQTYRGLLDYLRKHNVNILLFENVDSLDDVGDQTIHHRTNLEVVICDLGGLGMACLVLLMETDLFGLPCTRRRFYILALKIVAPRVFTFEGASVDKVFACVRDFLRLCQRRSPCASSILLGSRDGHVEKELHRRLAGRVKASDYNVSAVIAHFQVHGLRWGDVKVPRAAQDSPWLTTLSGLQKHALTFSYAEQPENIIFRDISQSLSRIRCSRLRGNCHIAFCQMPAQVVWVEVPKQQPRLLLGREALLLQGYPTGKIPKVVEATSELVMQGIAGNMMSSVIPLAILQAAFAALSWRDAAPIEDTTAEHVDLAMEVFALSVEITPDEMCQQAGKPRKLRRR